MAEIIASGTTEATSSDIVLADGASTTIFLKSGTGGPIVNDAVAGVQIKSSGGHYFTIGTLDKDGPAKVIQAPGTFRVIRYANAIAFGVDRD